MVAVTKERVPVIEQHQTITMLMISTTNTERENSRTRS